MRMGHIQRGHLERTMANVPPADVVDRPDGALGILWNRLLIAEQETLNLAAFRGRCTLPDTDGRELAKQMSLGSTGLSQAQPGVRKSVRHVLEEVNPSTMCLYSAASRLPRSLSAASQKGGFQGT
jgi:hypothetical protein